jgi:3-phosphoshikimate 1-carboxyvinyltransferase
LESFKNLGIKISGNLKGRKPLITVFGKGLYGLSKPGGPIFVGDSGTTLRLILGILAGQNFETRLIAGSSLSHRPMLRVTHPLRMMGAEIKAKVKSPRHKKWRARQELWREKSKIEEYPPITIRGGGLKGITYRIPVASAQVKSAVLLAGLYADGKTKITEPVKTRDHTERALKLFKAGIKVTQDGIVIRGGKDLSSPGKLYVPGDISSASFFIVLGSIIQGSRILIKNVSLNSSRMGIIKVLKRMGADIKIQSLRPATYGGREPMGDLLVRSSRLRGVVVKKEEVPSLIDELPILMVAACIAKGKTVLERVGELRVKETDRIKSMSGNLKRMGGNVTVSGIPDSENIIIEGVEELKGIRTKSFGDHRTAMSMIVAGIKAEGKTVVDDIKCINKSFPDFVRILSKLMR